jgi:hypothetical protein
MIRSRLDLYKKPGDEAVDEDPAYQGYNVDDLRQDVKSVGKALYGEPGGVPDLADLFQGVGRMLLPGQKLLTPEDEKNVIGADLEAAMAEKATQRIRPEVIAEGYVGPFIAKETGKRVEDEIKRQFNPIKAGLQKIQEPVLESVQDLAEGKPLYEFDPVQLTDLAFSVIDQIDVLGLSTIASRGIVKGLSSASQVLLSKLQSAPTRAAKIEIARMDPRTTMLLREELNRAQQMRETTENVASQQGDAFEFLAEPEMRNVRNLTGKPVRS